MTKNFPYTESELLKIASRFNKNLKIHFIDLQGFSSKLDSDFVFKFKAAYFKSRIHTADQQVDLFTHEMHDELNRLINLTRTVFQDFRFYIQKAFPHDSRMWDAYGYCEVEQATRNYDELLHCLNDFLSMIRARKNELLAVKCPEKSFNEIEDLFKKITEKHDEIVNWENKKNTSHEVRLNNLNKLYKLMQVVHNAASDRLKDDPQTMEKLTFPVPEN